jgi:hypothetical protein
METSLGLVCLTKPLRKIDSNCSSWATVLPTLVAGGFLCHPPLLQMEAIYKKDFCTSAMIGNRNHHHHHSTLIPPTHTCNQNCFCSSDIVYTISSYKLVLRIHDSLLSWQPCLHKTIRPKKHERAAIFKSDYHYVHVALIQTWALFRYQIYPQIPLCKKKIPHHIKMSAYIWSTKCRWNQKLIAQFCCTLRDECFKPN